MDIVALTYTTYVTVGYTDDMKVYLGKDWQHMAQQLTVTHSTIMELTRKAKEHGHKLYVDNIFSPDLVNDLTKGKTCGCPTK